MKAIETLLLLLTLATSVVCVSLELKKNVSMSFPSSYSSYPSFDISIGPKGEYVLCDTSPNSAYYLRAFDSSGLALWNVSMTLILENYYPYKVYARDSGIYVCGVFFNKSTNYNNAVTVAKFSWTGYQQWVQVPDIGNEILSGGSESIGCVTAGASAIFYAYTYSRYSTASSSSYASGLYVGAITFGGEVIASRVRLLNESYNPTSVAEMGGSFVIAGYIGSNSYDYFVISLDSTTLATKGIGYLHSTSVGLWSPYVLSFNDSSSIYGLLYGLTSCVTLNGVTQSCSVKTYVATLYIDGTIATTKCVGEFISTRPVVYNSMIAVPAYYIGCTTRSLLLLSHDGYIIQNITTKSDTAYQISDKNPSSNDLMVSSSLNTMAASTVSACILVFGPVNTCDFGYAYTPNNLCVACDPTCSTCSHPADSSYCTSCIPGLLPFDVSLSEFNCSRNGRYTSKVNCINGFASRFTSTLRIEGSYHSPNTVLLVNFNQDIGACPDMQFSASVLSSPVTFSAVNGTAISLALPDSTVASSCQALGSSSAYNCSLSLNLVVSDSGIVASALSILVYLDISSTSTVVSRLSFGVKTVESTVVIVNGTVAIHVETKICADETCSGYTNKTLYQQNDIVTIVHQPANTLAKLVAVTGMQVDLGNGTTKDAMSYLVSQSQNSDGSLTTKIQLLDSSSSGLILTFYMSNRLGSARRMLGDSLNYTKTSYTFVVAVNDGTTAETCDGFTLKCSTGALVTLIVSCVAVVLVGLVIVYCIYRRRMQAAKNAVDAGAKVETSGMQQPANKV